MKKHIDPRDDMVVAAFTAAERLRDVAPRPIAGRGLMSNRARIGAHEATIRQQAGRFLYRP
jgi:hypothetical protein